MIKEKRKQRNTFQSDILPPSIQSVEVRYFFAAAGHDKRQETL